MAFVNAKMTQDEKDEFAKNGIFLKESSLTLKPSRWTIDREENSYMIRSWKGREERSGMYEFILVWKGAVISAGFRKSWVAKSTCNWELNFIKIPPESEEKRNEIIQSLKDALTVYGFDGNPDAEDFNTTTIVKFSNI